jgi:hypothetical protein
VEVEGHESLVPCGKGPQHPVEPPLQEKKETRKIRLGIVELDELADRFDLGGGRERRPQVASGQAMQPVRLGAETLEDRPGGQTKESPHLVHAEAGERVTELGGDGQRSERDMAGKLALLIE